MAAIDTLIQILQGNKPGYRQSKDLEVWLKALGIGTDNIQIQQSAPGVLEIVARLKVQDGAAADEATSKGQLDAATASLDGDVAALDGRVTAAEGTITDHETRIGTAEGTIADHESRLDAAEPVIADHESRLSTAEGTIATHTGQIANHEGRITTNEGDIAGHETRIDTAETEIDQLQADLATIESNNPDEENFVAIAAQVLFTLTEFAVDADNSVRDAELFIDGRRQLQAIDGVFSATKTWRKNSTTEIEVAAAPGAGKVVTVYKQGTAVVVGGGSDLANITIDPRPSVNGGNSLGTDTKAWASLKVKDKASAQVWEIEVNNGVLQAVTVP